MALIPFCDETLQIQIILSRAAGTWRVSSSSLIPNLLKRAGDLQKQNLLKDPSSKQEAHGLGVQVASVDGQGRVAGQVGCHGVGHHVGGQLHEFYMTISDYENYDNSYIIIRMIVLVMSNKNIISSYIFLTAHRYISYIYTTKFSWIHFSRCLSIFVKRVENYFYSYNNRKFLFLSKFIHEFLYISLWPRYLLWIAIMDKLSNHHMTAIIYSLHQFVNVREMEC